MPHRIPHEKLVRLVQGVASIFFETDAAGKGTKVSDWTGLTGQRADDATNGGWLDAVHPEDAERASAAWRTAVDHGTAYNTEFRVLMDGGGYRWFNARAVPDFDGQGAIVGWMGMLMPVMGRLRRDPGITNQSGASDCDSIDPAALRAARAMLNWSADELADAASISRSTVRRMESPSAQNTSHRGTLDGLIQALTGAGLELLTENRRVTGVRLGKVRAEDETVVSFSEAAGRARG